MPIDYSNLTVEQMQNMSPEEFDQIDPSLLPQSFGSSQMDSDTLTQSPSNEVPVTQANAPEPITQPTTPTESEVPSEQPTETSVDTSELSPNANEERSDELSEKGVNEDVSTSNTEVDANTQTTDTTAADFYAKVTAKFNASGKEFQVTDANDVVSLMQKGIDYNIKMATLKPALKMVKALESHGITQEDLGLLIDIHQRKPEAIARLVKDAEIDLYAVDEDVVNQYAPTDARISDVDYEFNTTIEQIQHSPRYADVIGFLGQTSQEDQAYVYKNPGLLRTLVQQAEQGIFDQITNVIVQEQTLGRLPVGMSPLQAYNQIGASMFANQASNQPAVNNPVNTPVQTAPQPVKVPVQKPSAPANPARQAAAAPSTSKAGTPTSLTPQDIWKMSDEELSKIDPKFLTGN